MYKTEIILIAILYIADFTLTYFNSRKFLIKNPKANVRQYEMNQLVRYMWQKYGIGKGTLAANLFIAPLMAIFLFWIRNDLKGIYFVLGVYSIVFYIHAINFYGLYIRHQRPAESSGAGPRPVSHVTVQENINTHINET